MSQRFVIGIRKYLELNNKIATYRACRMLIKHYFQRGYLAKKKG